MGERAGNTNLYEVAVALHNCDVDVPLDLSKVYDTALLISEMGDLPIPIKAPLIGPDVNAHRSGIHQDGATKTKGMTKGAYRPIDFSIIGRGENDHISFTSQSGRTAVYEMISEAGYEISLAEASELQPKLKLISETQGELSADEVIEFFKEEKINKLGDFAFQSIQAIRDKGQFTLKYSVHDETKEKTISAEGPIEACLRIVHIEGFDLNLVDYSQSVVPDSDKLWAGRALSQIKLNMGDKVVVGRGVHNDTAMANMKAIFCAINLLKEA